MDPSSDAPVDDSVSSISKNIWLNSMEKASGETDEVATLRQLSPTNVPISQILSLEETDEVAAL